MPWPPESELHARFLLDVVHLVWEVLRCTPGIRARCIDSVQLT
jgi:hypothetical protein